MTTRPAGIWRPARPAQRLREERGGMAVGGQVAGEHLLRLRGGGDVPLVQQERWFGIVAFSYGAFPIEGTAHEECCAVAFCSSQRDNANETVWKEVELF